MDQNEYRTLKESGGLADDAGQQEAETEITDDRDEEEEDIEDQEEEQQEEEQDETADEQDEPEIDDEEEPEQLTPKEKTAFEKRLEREQKKIEEKLRAELEKTYSKHKEVIDSLGGDPDKILSAARENRIRQEAQTLAKANGWNDEQTAYYIRQQQQDQELKELRVQMQINKLKDNPDYAGISSMERDILAKIDKSNGALTAEEAYWALGGPKRISQIKLEEQQRAIAKRNEKPRTVQKDSPSSNTGEKPLPAQIMREAERMGVSAAEARRLMNLEPAQDIDDWRAKRKAK